MPFTQIAPRLGAGLTGGVRALCVAAAAAVILPTIGAFDGASAKTPGKTYCFSGTCHRVLTLAQTRRRVGKRHSVLASFYKHCKRDRYNPCGLTSSGAVYRPSRADNAASPIYPNGTKLLVWNPSNKRAAVVRINNAGPYWGGRTLDLSRAAASRLGFSHRGVARLTVTVLSAPTTSQARYRRHRVYAPVRGYIGRHASLSRALAASGGAAKAKRWTRVASLKTLKKRFKKRSTISRTRVARRSNRLPAKVVKQARLLKKSVRRRKVASLDRKSRRPSTRGSDKLLKQKKSKLAERRQARRTTNRSRRRAPRIVDQKIIKKTPGRRTSTSKYKVAARPSSRRAVAAPAAVKAPTVVARPKKRWRRKYFRPGGADA